MSAQAPHLSTPPSLPSTAPPAQLLQALRELQAETAPPSQRAVAQQLCEQFKLQTPAGTLLSTATYLLSSPSLLLSSSPPPPLSSDVIQHFALHLLEHLIAAHWSVLSAADQAGLQAYLLSFLASLAAASSPPSRLTLHKAPSLLTQLILRSWPQHWPELIPSLSSLASQSPTGSLLVALTYQELAEEVVNADASIADQRRREVQNAMIVSMEAVVSSLLSSLQQAEQQQQQQLVLTALAALRALVDWMPGRFVFDSALLPLLLQLLPSPPLYSAVCDVLAVVSNKKYAGIDSREPLLAVWRAALDAVRALLAAPAFAHQLSFLTHTLPLLSNLARNHLALLSLPAAASSSSSLPSPSPLLQHFLSTLGALFSHPHPVPSLCALELWVLLFRQERSSSLLSSVRPSLIAELLRLCVLKAQKQSSDELVRAEDDGEDRMELADYLLLFSHYRGVLISLIALMVQLEPLLCFSLALARYEQLLNPAAASQPVDNANRSGYTTTASTRFREMEGMAVMLDAMFRAAPSAAFAASALGETAARLLQLLLSFSTPDPLLHTRRLQALSLFTPVFTHYPATLPPTLSSLLSSVSFRSDRERDANATAEEVSEDSRACRRRAVHSLILIARKCRRQVAEMLPAVMGSVEAIVRGGEAGDDERLLLMEFVVTVSTGVEKREEQQAFVLRLLAEQLSRWRQEELQRLTARGRGWTELMGAGEDEVAAVRKVEAADDAAVTMRRVKDAVASTRGSRMRDELTGIISTFAAVFKAVVKASGEEPQPAPSSSSSSSSPPQPHPALPLLYELLPSCLQLLSSLYSLYGPSALSSLPPTLHGVLAASESQLQLLRASSPAVAASPDHQHAVLLHRFLFASIDTLLSLLSIATGPSPPTLYTAFPQPLFVSLLSQVPYLPPHLLRFLLDRFIAPLLASCPVAQYDALMDGVLGGTCDTVSRRLQGAWDDVRRRSQGGGGGEQLEIWEESELRECTRAFVDGFSRLVNEYELQASGRTAASRVSNRLPLSDCAIFSFVFSRPALAACFLSSLLLLLTFPDSPSQSKAVRLLQRCVPLATPHEQLHPLLASAVSLCLQSLAAVSSSPSSLSTADLDLIALITSAYQQMGRQCEAMRRSLRSVCGVREEEVAEVEARLWGEAMSDKKYRAAMKLLLTRHVIGSGRAVAVKDLPVRWERQLGQRLRESEERGAQVEAGELPSLFQQR